jgi:hypothetical protein
MLAEPKAMDPIDGRPWPHGWYARGSMPCVTTSLMQGSPNPGKVIHLPDKVAVWYGVEPTSIPNGSRGCLPRPGQRETAACTANRANARSHPG